MARTMKISPSVLAADFRKLEEEVRKAEAAGADGFHLDIMDGHFVPNLALGLHDVEAVRKSTSLPLDAHLMVENPLAYWERFADAGAATITAHIEVLPDPGPFIEAVRARGCKAGLAIRPGSDPARLQAWASRCDLVLQMSVEPGFYGQAFLPQVLPRIQSLRKILDQAGAATELQVDGGINPETLAGAARAGADHFVVGSAAFRSPDLGRALSEMRRLAAG